MTKEEIEKRLGELQAMEQQVTQAVLKGQADLQAINGAKQDCQFWLAKITESEKSETRAQNDFVPMQDTAPKSE